MDCISRCWFDDGVVKISQKQDRYEAKGHRRAEHRRCLENASKLAALNASDGGGRHAPWKHLGVDRLWGCHSDE